MARPHSFFVDPLSANCLLWSASRIMVNRLTTLYARGVAPGLFCLIMHTVRLMRTRTNSYA